MKTIEREEAVRLCLEGERLSPEEREGLVAERPLPHKQFCGQVKVL